MKIAVTATGPTSDASLDPRFGRSAYFLIVDTDTLNFKAIQNPNVMATGGAGIQSAQLVVAEGAQAVVSGSFGPNALRTLAAAGVQLYEGVTGTVREVVEKFKAGQLTVSPAASVGGMVPPAAGYGAGGGFGYGGGFGRGMGRGRGGRAGYGWGPMPGFAPAGVPGAVPPVQQPGMQNPAPAQTDSSGATVEMLKEQAKQLAEQLKQINQKIRELEGK